MSPSLSVYFHLPFCRRKCHYCDFYSDTSSEHERKRYTDALQRHVALLAGDPRWSGPVQTVFFGGGTPSLFPAAEIERLLQAVERAYGFTADVEISLEANPESVTLRSLQGYRRAGVNRLSFGIQSLSDDLLQRLGRRHTAAQAQQAVQWAVAAGFSQIGADLIFALPEQSCHGLEDQVVTLTRWPLTHLSCYGLTIEEGTPLWRQWQQGHVQPQDDDAFADQFLCIDRCLTEAGFEHYEISNYAKPGSLCRHNQAYWRRQPVVGFGAGAHGFSTQGWGTRWLNPADRAHYEATLRAGKDPMQMLETYDRDGAMAEHCYLALRTAEGIDTEDFGRRFGTSFQRAYAAVLPSLSGRLSCTSHSCSFPPEQWLLYDQLVQSFLL